MKHTNTEGVTLSSAAFSMPFDGLQYAELLVTVDVLAEKITRAFNETAEQARDGHFRHAERLAHEAIELTNLLYVNGDSLLCAGLLGNAYECESNPAEAVESSIDRSDIIKIARISTYQNSETDKTTALFIAILMRLKELYGAISKLAGVQAYASIILAVWSLLLKHITEITSAPRITYDFRATSPPPDRVRDVSTGAILTSAPPALAPSANAELSCTF